MLRKTMIVLATAAALTSGLTVDAFAHGGGGGHGGGSGGHGGGFGGGGHGGGFSGGGAVSVAPTWAADLALALRVRILPGRAAISARARQRFQSRQAFWSRLRFRARLALRPL